MMAAKLTGRRLKRGVFGSVADLQARIIPSPVEHNGGGEALHLDRRCRQNHRVRRGLNQLVQDMSTGRRSGCEANSRPLALISTN